MRWETNILWTFSVFQNVFMVLILIQSRVTDVQYLWGIIFLMSYGEHGLWHNTSYVWIGSATSYPTFGPVPWVYWKHNIDCSEDYMNLYMEYVCTEPGIDKSLVSDGFPASQEYYIHWSILGHVSALNTPRSTELHNIQRTRALPLKLSYSNGWIGAELCAQYWRGVGRAGKHWCGSQLGLQSGLIERFNFKSRIGLSHPRRCLHF